MVRAIAAIEEECGREMLALTNAQLELITSALRQLPTEEQRSLFLKLIDEQLRTRTMDMRDATHAHPACCD
jgi:hypothetical protein